MTPKQDPLFSLGELAAADDAKVAVFAGPGVPLRDGHVRFVAGMLSEYAFGAGPTEAQREVAVEAAREALAKVSAAA